MDLYCLHAQFPVFRIKIVELEPGVRTLTSQYNNLFKLPPDTARYHDDLKLQGKLRRNVNRLVELRRKVNRLVTLD